jgi:phospholipid-translocating ATPase
VKTNWKDVFVGDIVHLSVNELVPADILILRTSDEQGLCYVETANLDGESNLKQRQVVKGYARKQETFQPIQFTSVIECDAPNNQIYRFNGFIVEPNGEKIPVTKDNLLLRDCVLKNTDFVDGIVVYAGHETKAMLNNGGPRYKRSKLERFMNRDVIWCVVILLLLCTIDSIGYGLWLSSFENVEAVPYIAQLTDNSPSYDGFKIFWTSIILYQVMIPLSLYVAIEMIKLGQVYHIHQDNQLYDHKSNKRVVCRALNITEDLGQIEYIFSDKTGTLTENKMIFRRCTIGGIDYNHKMSHPNSIEDNQMDDQFVLNPHLEHELSLIERNMSEESNEKVSYQLSTQSQRILDFFLLLGVCNSAIASKYPHKDQMTGSGHYLNQLSVSSKVSPATITTSDSSQIVAQSPNTATNSKRPFFLSVIPRRFSPLQRSPSPNHSLSPSPLEFKPIYESESPDEVALVTAAFRYNCRLLKRNAEMVKLSLPSEGLIEFQVLNILPFDSTRKKMSIILRHPKTNEIILFCKGSDSAIYSNLAKTKDPEKQSIIEITQKQLNSYSRKGLRTLCMAKRVLSDQEYYEWHKLHQKAEQSLENNEQLIIESANRIEVNLELLGATGIEDRLQERVPEVIAALRMAGIVVWVLTGDKQETAVNIAYSCRLFTNDMEIIYLNVRSRVSQKFLIEKQYFL